MDIEIDAVIGPNGAIGLDDAAHLEKAEHLGFQLWSPLPAKMRGEGPCQLYLPPLASSGFGSIFNSPLANFLLIASISATTSAGTIGFSSELALYCSFAPVVWSAVA